MAKTKKHTITGDAGFNATLDEWARLTIEREGKAAALEAQLQAIRQEAEAELAKLAEKITALQAAAEEYAFTHRDRLLPEGRKSTETALTEWSLRMNPPSVKQMSKAWTVERTIIALTHANERDMLTTKVTLNKEAIHDQHGEDGEWLKSFGLRICQDEQFLVSVKRAVTPEG